MSQRVATFYRFAPLTGLDVLRQQLQSEAAGLDLKGTILLAAEGINGTVSGQEVKLRRFVASLRSIDGLQDLAAKFSSAGAYNPVFYRLKVRIRPEIVALGRPDVNPGESTGQHVDARTFNRLLDDPQVLVIDTRNSYEIAIGTFPGAVDPGTASFKQFPDYVASLDPAEHPKVAMFCTGGVRCEKASAFMLEAGFEEVYQLDGGILKYIETVAPEENRWQGECFVFDQRVSVDNDLAEGSFEQCFACRHPLDPGDLSSPDYQQGVSCPYCVDAQSTERRAAFEERQRQVELAAARGDLHVGKTMPAARPGGDGDQRTSSGSR